MNNYAEQIKQAVTMRQVCEMYGFDVNRKNKALCPFHNDGRASMHVYDGDRGYYCFSCGAHGDIITFVQKYFSLTFHSALDKLNNDFNIGLPIGKKLSAKEEAKAKKEINERTRSRIEQKTQKNRIIDRYYKALDKFTELDKKRTTGEEMAKNGIITDDFAEALREIEAAKYELQEAEARMLEYENRNRSNS